MKAYVRTRYGGPETLELVDVGPPTPTAEQVLVRVKAASVNAHDWHVLRGKPYVARFGGGLRRPRDREIGIDVAGVVEAVGSEVTHVAPGDEVFGSRFGAYAEVVAGKTMIHKPEGLTFEEAAAIPTAGLTALQGLRDKGALEAGQRVAINGAGGGVGTMAVQIAKALGGEVTAVTSTPRVEAVRSLGADTVIDYTRDDFTGAGPYDLILDVGGNRLLAHLRRALTPNGRIVMVAPQPGQWIGLLARLAGAALTNRLGARPATAFLAAPSREDLEVLKGLVESGRLRPVIDRSYPFAQVPAAIARLETGEVTGKVVISY